MSIEDINTAIETNATTGLKSVSVGAEKVEALPIADQIAAANHVASQTAAATPLGGLRLRLITPVYR